MIQPVMLEVFMNPGNGMINASKEVVIKVSSMFENKQAKSSPI
jgi:hypothetical protein